MANYSRIVVTEGEAAQVATDLINDGIHFQYDSVPDGHLFTVMDYDKEALDMVIPE